jgi:hypothetical protein
MQPVCIAEVKRVSCRAFQIVAGSRSKRAKAWNTLPVQYITGRSRAIRSVGRLMCEAEAYASPPRAPARGTCERLCKHELMTNYSQQCHDVQIFASRPS